MSGDARASSALGDYVVVGPLSEGGHGRFFVAVPPARLQLTDNVVVKVIAGAGDTAFRRFTRELKLFSRIASPHLVTLYDAGQHEDVFFYSMEWCRGGTLAEPAEPMTPQRAVRAVADASRAAHALHEAGIAHRDIRPGNVLLRADGSACLGDLSLAQTGSGSVTSMAPVGSIGYVDPSLILGDNATRATDIFSLGALLHRMLTGETVYPSADASDPMLAVRAVLRNPPHVASERLQPDAADLIAACIHPDPAQRPSTADELATLIDSLQIREDPL